MITAICPGCGEEIKTIRSEYDSLVFGIVIKYVIAEHDKEGGRAYCEGSGNIVSIL